LGIRLESARENVGVVLVLLSGMLMSFTMLWADPVGAAICGEECATSTMPLSVMPLYFALMIVGITNSTKPYVRHLLKKDFSQKDFKRLFLGLVVSGGSVFRRDGKYCIRYYGKDAGMHTVFGDLAYQIYSARPQTVRVNGRGTYMSQFYSKPAVLEMAEFSPELASRKGETPSISYILEGDRMVKIEAVRIMMSTSGWVNCTFSFPYGPTKAYPRLGFGSVLSSSLTEEYSCLTKAVPLQMERYPNNKYPKRGYLATSDKEEMQSFIQAGGFLHGSTVKKGAFSGIEKNKLLQVLVGTRGVEFQNKEAAIELLTRNCSDSSLELNIYLDRLRLG